MTELVQYNGGQVEQYRAALAMTPEDAKALDDQLRACTLAVLREGTDYGTVPGTNDNKVLLKPGAEKLLQWFGLGYAIDRQDVETGADGLKEGVTYRATITKQLPDGRIVAVATCEGYAGYDEAKFYQSAEAAQAKAENKERMWAAKDRRVANPNKWKFVTEYRAPWNTIIKMAQKRALVGATIGATAAAGLFSADDEDGPVAEDGGMSVYQLLIVRADRFTDPGEAGPLTAEAGKAARDGLCTPGQATHVKNRIRQRLELLKKAKPVDVEDLGRQDGGQPEDEPGSVTEAQLTKLHTVLTALGFSGQDRDQKLVIAEAITGRAPLHGPAEGRSSKNLSLSEARKLIDTLDGFDGDRDALIAFMAEHEDYVRQEASGE